MEDGEFRRDLEDHMIVPTPINVVLNAFGIRNRAGCSGAGDMAINADASRQCQADTEKITPAVYSFVNSPADVQTDALQIRKVCDHYKQRFEEQIRRQYNSFTCGSGEVKSVNTQGLARTIKYNSEGHATAVKIEGRNDQSFVDLELQNQAPHTLVRREMAVTELRPKQMSRMGASHLSSSLPVYLEVARLKLEAAEMIHCCRSADAQFKQACSAGFSATATAVESTSGDGIAR